MLSFSGTKIAGKANRGKLLEIRVEAGEGRISEACKHCLQYLIPAPSSPYYWSILTV